MNFFECTLVEKDGGGVLNATEFQVPLSKENFAVIRKDASASELVLGVRPEDMEVTKHSVPNGIKAKVYVTEPIGDSVIVDARISGTLVKAKADPSFQARLDDIVYLTFEIERMHVFDKKTGNTII
jgi:multiple sugar transport system ATP-binding protein